MFEKAAGIQLTHVPYKSAAAAATDVVSGQVPLSIQSLPSSLGFIKTGKLKVIATINEKRVAALPDTPTVGETFSGFGATPWYGVLAPAGTPKPVIDRMQAAIFEALDSKDVQEQLGLQGCEVFKRIPASSRRSSRPSCRSGPRWSRTRARPSTEGPPCKRSKDEGAGAWPAHRRPFAGKTLADSART
jgi:hypothetical protein